MTRTCPICGFVGAFVAGGQIQRRIDAVCPKCRSFERHRLLKLYLDVAPVLQTRPRLLHFAPEPWLIPYVKSQCSKYVTADYIRPDVDLKLNIEDLDLEKESFDAVICSHVLEHVDDHKALRELHRILTPNGTAIIAVPIEEGLKQTYEDPSIVSPADRVIHFGQEDHLRRYGRDFRDRVRGAGFALDEFVTSVPDSLRYSILLDEPIFIARKTA